MGSDTLPTTDPDVNLDQSPASIERTLGGLIRHYARTRSPAIARSVVRHIDILCTHPAFEGDERERCAYLRLKAHWRWLAIEAAAMRDA